MGVVGGDGPEELVPTYLQALEAAAQTDLVAFVPSRLIAARASGLGLVRLAPPVDAGVDEQFLLHPARLHADLASVWMRRLILEIAWGLPDAGHIRATGAH